jgi:hypothetical protein
MRYELSIIAVWLEKKPLSISYPDHPDKHMANFMVNPGVQINSGHLITFSLSRWRSITK